MATRIYLPSSGAAPVTPSTWNFPEQINPLTFAGVIAKINSTLTSKLEATGTTSPTFRAMLRYVIGPLTEQNISGTIHLQMRAMESSTAAQATFAIAVKIIKSDGTDRAVLLACTAADYTAVPWEFLTDLTNRRAYNASEVHPIPLTAQDAVAGDYLVIEIGFRSAATTSRNITLRYGDNSANDMEDDVESTNDYAPWVEFSGTISFGGGYSIVAEPGSYALSGQAAGVYYGRAIDADGGVYELTGADVTMPRTYKLIPDAGVYALTGSDLAALYGRLLSAGAGTYAVTGADIAALYGRLVTAGAGTYDLTGSDVAALYGRAIDADTGEYIVTGQAVTLTYTPGGGAYIITADGGTYAVTGTEAGLLLARKVVAGAGDYAVTGAAVSPLLGRVVSVGAGEYLVTGAAAATLLGRLISAASGSYLITGSGVTLTYTPSGAAYILTAEGGTYAVTGVDAALLRAARIAPSPGTYDVTGMDAATLIGRLVDAGAGVYDITGTDAALLRGAKVAAGAGVYTIDGQAATLVYSASGQYTLVCASGSYAITGTAATLLKHILHPDTIYPKAPTRSIEVDGPKRKAVVGEKYKATVSRRRTWS